MKIRSKIVNLMVSTVAVSVAGLAMGVSSPALAQSAQCDAEEGGPSKTLDARTGSEVQKLFEFMQNDQWQEALAGFNNLISSRGESMKPYDKSTVYELRANVKVNLEDYRGAQRDMQVALDTGGLPANRNNQLRYFIAQLNFQMEQYQNAITGLNQWIRFAQQCGQPVDSNAYYLLAAAYASVQPPNYRAAQDPIEKAIAGTVGEPRKGYYDLANLIYSELSNNAKRMPLLETMVQNWPEEKGYWTQLSGAYSQQQRDRDAFSVLEVAYRAGLLTTENELKTLIQYYSFFENPYRGAVMMEREMNAGNIKRDQNNLILLSQLWSQAREHKKSIPILREAARNSSDGELSYRLGMVLLADEQYAAAQTALEGAINKGRMDRRETGDAWLLLGTARFSQAGPADTGRWNSAKAAFRNAQRYETARKRATDWIAYIDAVIDTYWSGLILEYNQNLEACNDDLARFEREQRIRDLQNRIPAPEEIAREEARIAECEALIAQGPPSRNRGAAPAEGSDNEESAPAPEPEATNDDE